MVYNTIYFFLCFFFCIWLCRPGDDSILQYNTYIRYVFIKLAYINKNIKMSLYGQVFVFMRFM